MALSQEVGSGAAEQLRVGFGGSDTTGELLQAAVCSHCITRLLSEAEQACRHAFLGCCPSGEFISVFNTFDGELT